MIYGLVDPRTGLVRYIGKANDPAERLKGHIRDARRHSRPVSLWIRELLESSLRPEVRVLEVAEDWQEAERRLIAVSRARGDALLNLAAGGNQPFATTEQRQRNANRLNASLRADPRRARARFLKARMMRALNEGGVNNRVRFMLRIAAAVDPEQFGAFADVPYRTAA